MSSDIKPNTPGGGDRKVQGNNPNNRKNRFHANRQTPIASKKFEGATEGMKGHIFDCNDHFKQADAFSRSCDALANFVGGTFKLSGPIRSAITNLQVPVIPLPADPVAGASDTVKKIWEKDIDSYCKKREQLQDNVEQVYSIVWGQCTEAMQAKVKQQPTYPVVLRSLDGIELLKLIKVIVFQYQSTKYLPISVVEALKLLFSFKQHPTSTISHHHEQFENMLAVINLTCKEFGNVPSIDDMVAAELDDDYSEEDLTDARRTANKAEAIPLSKNRFLAAVFLSSLNKDRYNTLLEDLENDYLHDIVKYPRDVYTAYTLAANWKCDSRLVRGGNHNDGVNFNTTHHEDNDDDDGTAHTNTTNNNTGRDMSHVYCKICKSKAGHYTNKCPSHRKNTLNDSDTVSAMTNTTSPPGSITPAANNSSTSSSAVTMLMSGVDSGEFDSSAHHFQFMQHDPFTGVMPPDFINTTGVAFQTNCGPHPPDADKVKTTWILLDNQSTVDVFCNPTLLKNIRHNIGSMSIHTNAGVTTTNTVGDLDGYGTVWYDRNGIANIISLSRALEKGYHVTYDSQNGNSFTLQSPHHDRIRKFQQSPRGLFFLDTMGTNAQPDEACFAQVNTVAENRLKFTHRDHARAVVARDLQQIIGRPSTRTFLKIVDNNLIPNCPVTRRDVQIAEAIFGPDVGSLKGKTVRQAPDPVEVNIINVPSHIITHYRTVILAADIMFVNRVAFFVSVSRHIKFGTTEMISNQTPLTITKAIKHIKSVYAQRGFILDTILMDGQFEVIRPALADIQVNLNIVSRGEHVPEAERYIRVIKERTRAVFNTLPFTRVPNRIIIELVYYATFWLNSFPAVGGVSVHISPRGIVTGAGIDFHAHCRIQFGTYAQVHEEHDNSLATRTTGALALRPTGNQQGGYYFYSLNTGRLLNRNHWTALPMPADVIDRIHQLARRDRANIAGLVVADRFGNAIVTIDDDDDDDDDPDEEWLPDDHDDPDDDDLDDDEDDDDPAAIVPNAVHAARPVFPAPLAGVQHIANNDDDDDDADDDDDIIIDNPNGPNNNNTIVIDDDDDPIEPDEDDEDDEASEEDDDNLFDVDEEEADADQNNLAANMDAKYGARGQQYNLRARKAPNYDHLHLNMDMVHDYRSPKDAVLESIAMTQHGIKKGLKLFGEPGVNAVLKELSQLDDRNVLEAVDHASLTFTQKKAALEYLMFLKQKRSGDIKGRGCADGRKQRLYTKKEDATSPTVRNESVFITSVVDAHERRDVATVDLPGAFMHSKMDELVHMRMEGTMADLLIKLNPKYGKYKQIINGKTVIYVRLLKALYGTLRAALLFWRLLSSRLIAWGFQINEYDSCVANKIINGKQCTIVWHVDDLKISHVDYNVVTSIIELLQADFGKEAPLTITRGAIHEYLGMKLDFTTKGMVRFTMIDYIKGVLQEAPEDMTGEAATPAADHLFEVNETNPIKLDNDTSETFHHIVAKLLFLCKRARPDIQTTVAFLCTRVQSPDTDDYKKLSRLIAYLRGTVDMPLSLEANNFQLVKWWVDASFAVHRDFKSHTGGAMSFGKGVVYGTSTRQKLNTKSSTEAELVGADDVLPQILWTQQFLEAQGYGSTPSILYQDNQSAILLEKNGRASSGKRTRHLNIRYFFITDRVSKGQIKIEYCPTGAMIADFFTKPLQGVAFQRFRNFIMNIEPASDALQVPRSVLKRETWNAKDKLAVTHAQVTFSDPIMTDGWTLVQARNHKRVDLVNRRLKPIKSQ